MSRKAAPTSRQRPAGERTRAALLSPLGNDDELARETLRALCRNEKIPGAARATAARTLLELSGALKNPSTPETKTPSELTLEELDTRIASLDTEDTQARDGV